ncbi:ABC transporter substrate-binding protein [Chengkuizengella sp. SCS-71B]|uniref:ABC transporter substrate-binding protein n=1 Tax=Chengkuizengella sp. SCS-71B TaxID=3115290 RepID=UPI0032C217A5
MKLIEHYLILNSAYATQKNGVEFETTLSEIIDILGCSQPNAKGVLNRLKKQGWIRWKPGRGRGYRSRINFQLSLFDGIKMYVSEQLAQDHFKEGMEFLHSLSIPTQIHSFLGQYLEEWFGFQTEGEKELKHILRIPMYRNLISLDPAQVSTAFEYHFAGQIYDTLLRIDSTTKQIYPHLALGWDTPNEKEWIFYLRKGIRFHHGRLLTSEDVIYTFQRVLDSSVSVFYWLRHYLNKVESSGDHTVIFHFKQPFPFFPNILSSNKASIVPYDVDFKQQVVGTGPFFVRSFSTEKLILEAFDHYFKERAWLDRVEIFRFPEELQGRFSYKMTTRNVDSLEVQEKTVNQHVTITQLIIFQTKKPGPQQHPAFRRAIRLALDRNTMINDTTMKEVQPADSFLHTRSKKKVFPSYTLSEAQEALKESGYSGETLTMFIPSLQWRENALWIQSRCNQIGVSLELQPLDLKKTLQKEFFQQAHLIMINVILVGDSEINLIEPFGNNSLYRQVFTLEENQQMDRFTDRFISGKTTNERLSIWCEMEDWFRQENLILFQFHFKEETAYSSNLQGYKFGSLGMYDFHNLWIKDK